VSAVEIKLTEMQENLTKKKTKNFSQCHSTLNFGRQAQESKYPEFKTPVYKYNSFLCIAQHIAVMFSLQ